LSESKQSLIIIIIIIIMYLMTLHKSLQETNRGSGDSIIGESILDLQYLLPFKPTMRQKRLTSKIDAKFRTF